MKEKLTKILSVSFFLPLQVHHTVAHPELGAALRTLGYLNWLTMDHQKKAW